MTSTNNKNESDCDIIQESGMIELPKPDRPARKRKSLHKFVPAVAFNKETGEKEFLARVGDTIFIEFRGSPWRDDTYYEVLKIDGVTGDLHLFNIGKKNLGASNFKDVEKHDYHIWIPPKNKGPRAKR